MLSGISNRIQKAQHVNSIDKGLLNKTYDNLAIKNRDNS